MSAVAEILAGLDLAPAEAATPLYLQVGEVRLELRCPDPLRAELADYFAEALGGPGPVAGIVQVLPNQSPALPALSDWAREPGKTGRKDAIADLVDGRIVHKVRTGVGFLQSQTACIAWGPVDQNPNQVINFINTQILNICLRAGWQLAHAAAITDGARGLAIAGLSGGGKSTSVLRLMDLDQTRFVSNDRLLLRPAQGPALGLGIPKHPRINPGTILGNPRLHGMLSPARRAELAAMAPPDLWQLEQKHDLIVGEIYGPGRIQYGAPISEFWVLNWAHDSAAPTALVDVTLAERPDLLGAILKSPGPFYADAAGRFLPNGAEPDGPGMLAALAGVRVREVTGRVDFDVLAAAGQELFA